MKKKDQERLYTLYALLGLVPLPHDGSGSHTASIAGAMYFARDMRELLSALQEVVRCMISDAIPEIPPDKYSDPKRLATAIHAWKQYREEHNWYGNIPRIMSFYRHQEHKKQPDEDCFLCCKTEKEKQ